MKYKILQLDEHGRISFSKEELEKLLDEVYEQGRRDGAYRYPYYWYTNTGTAEIPTIDKTITITCDSNTIKCDSYTNDAFTAEATNFIDRG